MNSFARHPVTKDSSDDLQIKENVLRSGFHSTVVNDQTAMHDATSRSTCIAVDDFCGDDGYGNECQWTRLCRNSQNSNADEYVSLHGQINSGKRCYENEVSCCIAEPIYNKENHSSNEKRILAGTRISQTDTPFGSEPSTRQKHISLNGNKMHSVNPCLAGVLPCDKDFLVTCSPNYSSCHIDNQVSPVSFSASCNPVTQLNTLNLNYAESATDGILSNESVFDSPTATISCATSSSAELVPVSPLLSVNSCSEEIAAVVPQAAYDNGYCSDEVCYSASSECDGLQHAVSPELVPTFKCINHFDFSARDLRLKEMQHPLQHSDGNRQKDSCTTKITIAEGHPLVNVSSKPMIESESVPECCLVSKWLSAVSATPVAVTSIQDNNSFRNKPAKDATTYSEQHNSTDSANAALFSLDNQLLDVHSLTCLETCTVQTVSNALHLRLQEGEEQADEQNLSCSPIEGNPLMYTSNSGQGNTCMTVNGSLQIDETDCLASDTSDQQNNCDLYRGNDLAGISSNMNQCQFCQECVSIDAAVINPFKTLNDPLAEQVSHNILPEVCAVKAVQTSCEKPEVDGTKCILFRAGFAGTRCRICEQDFQQTSVIPLSHSVNGHTKRIYKVGLNVFNMYVIILYLFICYNCV